MKHELELVQKIVSFLKEISEEMIIHQASCEGLRQIILDKRNQCKDNPNTETLGSIIDDIASFSQQSGFQAGTSDVVRRIGQLIERWMDAEGEDWTQ